VLYARYRWLRNDGVDVDTRVRVMPAYARYAPASHGTHVRYAYHVGGEVVVVPAVACCATIRAAYRALSCDARVVLL